MKIDIFSHFLPQKYIELLGKGAETWVLPGHNPAS